jgi:WD40 repeat protein
MRSRSYWVVLAGILIAGSASAAPPITAAAFSPDARQVVLGSQDGIEVRSWPDLKISARVETELSHVHDLAFAPDGKVLLAAGGWPAEKGVIEVLSWPDGKRLQRVADCKDLVYRVAWSPKGEQWAAASADGTCRVYAADSAKPLLRYEGHSRAVLAITFLPDGKTALSAGVDQTLQLWEVETGKPLRTLDNHVAPVNDLATRPQTPEGTPAIIVSASDDRTVRLWQPTTGRLMRFARVASAPRAAAWTADGRTLLIACKDGRVRVIDPDTVEVLRDLPALDGVAHSLVVAPDGSVLVGGENGQLRRLAKDAYAELAR